MLRWNYSMLGCDCRIGLYIRIEGFLGYLLCWGQMSYWGITVMINIVAVLPCCGVVIAELIWSAAWVILNRIFVYHFFLTFYWIK